MADLPRKSAPSRKTAKRTERCCRCLPRRSIFPGRGWNWGLAAGHHALPRGGRVRVGTVGTLEEILLGPAGDHSGTTNLLGGVRKAMALTGHASVKEMQKADLVVGS